jgi:hypothetical protein
MRIFEIAPGEKRAIKGIEFDQLWERVIAPNCSEIIEVYQKTGRYLYRGAKNNPPIYRGRSLDARRPTNSHNVLSDLFNKMLAANGMTALRNNSIFTSSSRSLAKNFGTIYVVFPINGFNFTYTNELDIVLDSIGEFIEGRIYNELNQKFASAWASQGNDAWRVDWISTDNVHLNPIQQLQLAINRLKTMLPKDLDIQDLSIDQLINPQTFADIFDPSNTNLEHAIKSILEVYIQGQYYAIEYDPYKSQLSEKIRMNGEIV